MYERFPKGGLVKVFIRHGISVNNERAATGDPHTDRVGGYQPKVELSPRGHQQAAALGGILIEALSDKLASEDFDVVRFSTAPARRTRDTAAHVYESAGLTAPFVVRHSLHEIRKGNRWLGGDEKRLRRTVETPATRARRSDEDWDFRHGRAWLGQLGLQKVSGAETAREAGDRIKQWIEEVPPMPDSARTSGRAIVDIAVGHGLSGRYGMALVLHAAEDGTATITSTEADNRYQLANASATILTRTADTGWQLQGSILPPAAQAA